MGVSTAAHVASATRRWRVAAAVGLVLLAWGAIAFASGSQAATHETAPVTVPLKIRFGIGTPNGAQPLIMVKVGNGRTVPVILDTGSVGLHIFSPGVNLGRGGGVTRTHKRNSIEYVDGTVQSGVVARAKITIGGVTTTKAIPFGLITRVSCVASKPHCPTSHGIQPVVKKGSYGVMGVRFQPVRPGVPPNPLVNLRAPYSNSYSMAMSGHSGKLVLAAPTMPGAVLKLAGSMAKATVCWTIGTVKNVCEHSLFDSGNPSMFVFGGPLTTAPTTPGGLLKRGTVVSASVMGASKPFWKFTAGYTTSKNMVQVGQAGISGNTVNASIEAFYAFTLTWNKPKRTLTLSPRR